MGFFSKKKEKDEESLKFEELKKQAFSSLYKQCPICHNNDSWILDQYIGHKDFGNGLTSGSYKYDMKDYTGGNVVVCHKCGFVAHGTKYFKGKDFNESCAYCVSSLMIVNDWKNLLNIIASRDGATDDMLNREFASFIQNEKKLYPEVFEALDVLNFISQCFEYKFKHKVIATESVFKFIF